MQSCYGTARLKVGREWPEGKGGGEARDYRLEKRGGVRRASSASE